MLNQSAGDVLDLTLKSLLLKSRNRKQQIPDVLKKYKSGGTRTVSLELTANM